MAAYNTYPAYGLYSSPHKLTSFIQCTCVHAWMHDQQTVSTMSFEEWVRPKISLTYTLSVYSHTNHRCVNWHRQQNISQYAFKEEKQLELFTFLLKMFEEPDEHNGKAFFSYHHCESLCESTSLVAKIMLNYTSSVQPCCMLRVH